MINTHYTMIYAHLPVSRLQQIRRSTALLLKTFDTDNISLQTAHYKNMAARLQQEWKERLQYLDYLINQHAQPPIPLPKPTQPNNINHC